MLVLSSLLLLLLRVFLLSLLVEPSEALVRILFGILVEVGRVRVKSVLAAVLVSECSFGVASLLPVLFCVLRETCEILILLLVWILGLRILGSLAEVKIRVTPHVVVLLALV
jgi:hypothetical protein